MRRCLAIALLVLCTACTPIQMLNIHRAANPDGPYSASSCRSPEETGTRWDCAPDKVAQLRREAARATQWWAAVAAARAAQAQHQDLVWHWELVANCESGGNWQINTGNGYYGGLQFTLSTWRSVGGSGYPHEHSAGEQSYRAEILRVRSGLGQWPVCGHYYR